MRAMIAYLHNAHGLSFEKIANEPPKLQRYMHFKQDIFFLFKPNNIALILQVTPRVAGDFALSGIFPLISSGADGDKVSTVSLPSSPLPCPCQTESRKDLFPAFILRLSPRRGSLPRPLSDSLRE